MTKIYHGETCQVETIQASQCARTGQKIVTLVLEYPRVIHSQLLTHRVFTKNSSSTRAVPAKRVIEQLQARVVELEGEVHNKASAYNQLCDKYCEVEGERDALAAHVERLRDVVTSDKSSLMVRVECERLLDSTPQATLAERDAASFSAGFRAGCDNTNGSDATDAEIEKAANEYAERDAEVARKAFIALRSKLKGEDWEDDELRIFLDDFTDEYAERIKRGDV